MGLSGTQTQTWRLLVCLSWMCVGGAMAELHYMVAVPAVIEAGAETQFCASLLQPNETVVMTVTLISIEKSTTLLTQTSSEEFHACTQFTAPVVQNQDIQTFEVEVRGDTFYSKEVRKVMIKVYKPMTFVQTDKPIYLPGQTVHFRVITLDTRFRPVSQLYSVIEMKDCSDNRIGQWLNENSNGRILQLSYSLNSEAREGTYHIVVSVNGQKTSHSFKVEKYVLPKFDMKMNVPDEVSIGQEEFKAEVCLKYTYGQPVPGSVEMKICRPLERHERKNEAQCYEETKETDKTGCTTYTLDMSSLTNLLQHTRGNTLDFFAKAEEEGTGISLSQEKTTKLSYQVGKLSFIDTPKFYHSGSVVEGKVKAVNYNNIPIPDMVLYISEGRHSSARQVQSVTTDHDGIAAFSFNTTNYKQDILLYVSSLHC
ncbi:hypothetical protein INR49_010118 [Caranx melampygus]|nr:hypothetical protein INR49_010118 [Caranx melampygus]